MQVIQTCVNPAAPSSQVMAQITSTCTVFDGNRILDIHKDHDCIRAMLKKRLLRPKAGQSIARSEIQRYREKVDGVRQMPVSCQKKDM